MKVDIEQIKLIQAYMTFIKEHIDLMSPTLIALIIIYQHIIQSMEEDSSTYWEKFKKIQSLNEVKFQENSSSVRGKKITTVVPVT